MKLDSNDIELIEKHIADSLNADEAVKFEEKYRTSDSFRESVNFQRSLLSSLEANKKAKLKEELYQMLQDVDAKQVIPIANRWYLIAASIAILLGVFWIFNLTTNNEARLFESYFEPFPTKGYLRGDISASEIDEILQLYADKDYDKTIGRINALPEESFDGQMLYLGNSYLALSQSEEAIQIFQSIEPTDRYYADSQWYLALAYLANSEREQAKKILLELSTKNTIYTTSALTLIEELE